MITNFRTENRKITQDIEKVQKSLNWQKMLSLYGTAGFSAILAIIFIWWGISLHEAENELKEAKIASISIIKRAKKFNPQLDTVQNNTIFDFVTRPKIHDLYYYPDKYTFIPTAELKELRRTVKKYLKEKNKPAEVNQPDSLSR